MVLAALSGCSDSSSTNAENSTKLMEGEFSSMSACMEVIKSAAVWELRTMTDKPNEISGFHGSNDKIFACQKKESGSKGVYYRGMIDIPR